MTDKTPQGNEKSIKEILYFVAEYCYDNPSNDNPFTGDLDNWIDQALKEIQIILDGAKPDHRHHVSVIFAIGEYQSNINKLLGQ